MIDEHDKQKKYSSVFNTGRSISSQVDKLVGVSKICVLRYVTSCYKPHVGDRESYY